MTPSTREIETIVGTSCRAVSFAAREVSAPRTGSSYRLSAAVLALAIGAAATAQQPQPISETVPGTTVKLSFVPVPAGKVSIADPADATKKQEVDVRPFYLSTTEVPFDIYDVFVYRLEETDQAPGTDATTRPSKPYIPPDRGFGHAGFAAIGMSFKGADEFCAWLSKKTGHKYRLATEAEWEYAARAGASGNYGVDGAKLAEFAWFKDNADAKTHPIASKKPNAWGLFDMHGNAAEWVVGADGKPVTKGGSFKDDAADLEIADRVKPSAAWNASDPQMPKSKWWLADCSFVGFRIVREMESAAKPQSEPPTAPSAPKSETPKDRIDDHPAPSVPR